MKKTLLSILGVVILIFICVAIYKGISVGGFSVYSVGQIKSASENLDKKIIETDTEINQNYAENLEKIETAISELRKSKEEYEEKIATLKYNPELGVTQIEKYKSEYLWVKIGKYATDENLKINLEIKETSINDTYNINFSLIGSYLGITNFLYNIENDDDLNYRIKDFKITPNNIKVTDKNGKDTTKIDTQNLKATFVVESIIIIN